MRHKGQKPDINVTPLVDIVLVLLIIFMIVVPQLEAGVSAAPPVATNVDPESETEGPLILTVTKHGEYYIDKYAVEDLEASLRAERAASPNRPVRIRADQSARYGAVRHAFSLCQELGIPGVPLEVGENKAEDEES